LLSYDLFALKGITMMPMIYFLSEEEQLLVRAPSSQYAINGPRVFIKPPFHKIIERRKGVTLSANEYVHIGCRLTGAVTFKDGPSFFFLKAHDEVVLEEESLPLKEDQFVEVINSSTGETKIIRGECSYKLAPFESVRGKVQNTINVDEHRAVVVRDVSKGGLHMITKNQSFAPGNQERIESIREKVLLEEHEVMVLKDEKGSYHFKHGNQGESAFFVAPYWEVLGCNWSSGLHKQARDLEINKFDLRPKFMWYEFDVRTRDNVELMLKVTFFWQIQDVETLVKTTDDATGDLCSHARSRIIQRISRVHFSEFLDQFNSLVQDSILDESDDFYCERGIHMHSVEVRQIACKDEKTQEVLSEIIQETTTRINRIQKQESENEVLMKRIEGELIAEEHEMKLTRQKLKRFEEEARSEGRKEAHSILTFLQSLGKGISLNQKLKLFETLKQKEIMVGLGQGNSKIFLTPEDIQLKLEVQES
jgi:regulator of protease activity HflC (stomatin/prohibitin superfamily)